MSYTRFAIYYLPPKGALADFGAGWLGWDVARGCPARQPVVSGLDRVTAKPRKYGFHATLKPPFRLAAGLDASDLAGAVADVAASSGSAGCDGLQLGPMGRFLALTPVGDACEIGRVAARFVSRLDGFRAPPDEAETARRRMARLSAEQEALLTRWGYPYVMEAFRFHMTLTGPLPRADMDRWTEAAAALLPALPAPFVIDAVALVGERIEGQFELIQRYPLSG